MVNFNKNNSASIGVLMVNTSFTRIPGDIGNPSTFDFPVRYEVIQEATPNKMLSLDDANYLIPLFVKASKKLETSFYLKLASGAYGIKDDRRK